MMGRVLFSRAAGKIPLRTESESRPERNEGASHTRCEQRTFHHRKK